MKAFAGGFLCLLSFIINSFNASAQAEHSREDRRTLRNLRSHISFLADDKLEGRRTGSAGEEKAANYIAEEFRRAGLLAAGTNNGFFSEFPVYESAHGVTDSTQQPKRFGKNVVGYIDNKQMNTIVIGAHYDHLGYGEDQTSLYTGKEKMIHNGADDNASGTAALIELARKLNRAPYTKYNFLFAAFSGEELGLFGSKNLLEYAPVPVQRMNYMINMDMIGRLNDSTHALSIGGYGTSPAWSSVISAKDNYFKIALDSSGSGPSDHTSFYRRDMPVLFFFTGAHKDYHKPTDDADKINYEGELRIINYIMNVIAKTNEMEMLTFTKTRETMQAKSSFKVTLGIMPDYTFSGPGVRVDGVSDNRPAQKAGVLANDVITQLGDYPVTDVQGYMGALNKFNKGDSTTVKLIRGKDELILPVTF